ncbi:hypothetical protein LTR85_002506 [Meristemomyces frigidus]|nr:hypothetical protein LTR85_002506 [Meristemomyces frigidus]
MEISDTEMTDCEHEDYREDHRLRRSEDEAVQVETATTPRNHVTKVQWDYDQAQKSEVNDGLSREWQAARDKLRALRRSYTRMHQPEPLNKLYQKQLRDGDISSPEEFYEHLFSKWWPLAYRVLQDWEEKFQQTQDTAMRAGLEPTEIDSDIMVFEEHLEDGTVESGDPGLWREIGQSMNDAWLTRQILWSLRVPRDQLEAYQSPETPEADKWEADSVCFGSSRSQWWRMGQPPSVKRKALIRSYRERCEQMREEAEKVHNEYMREQ